MATHSAKKNTAKRFLIAFFALIFVLYLVMALTHTFKPQLGLDLRGGTTITLTAKQADSDSVSAGTLEQAKQIIQQRVDGLGVGETTITVQGQQHIVVSAPGTNQDALVAQVGQTAQLAFRQVHSSGLAGGTPGANPSDKPLDPIQSKPSPKPTPSSEQNVQADPNAKPLPLADVLAWKPSEADTTAFANFKCGDPTLDQPDKPLLTCDDHNTYKYLLGPVALTGDRVTEAYPSVPQNDISFVVVLNFDSAGSQQFADITKAAMKFPHGSDQNRFAIVLDGTVVSAPSVQSEILGGQATISGSFDQESASALANVLKYGALPISFEVSSVDNVSPTLGGNQLHGGLVAAIIGLLLVAVYCFIYYRGLGVVVIGSLVAAGVLSYAFICLLGPAMGFALSLPGLAGAVLAIGTTADSFIIYFERIKDEIREGRSLRSAIESGWVKARSTIVIADMVSILSATVLFILAVGSVKGFAFMLGLTTVLDLIIVFFFTHPMMTLLGKTKFFGQGHKWSGLNPELIGVSKGSLLGVRERTANAIKAKAKAKVDRLATNQGAVV